MKNKIRDKLIGLIVGLFLSTLGVNSFFDETGRNTRDIIRGLQYLYEDSDIGVKYLSIKELAGFHTIPKEKLEIVAIASEKDLFGITREKFIDTYKIEGCRLIFASIDQLNDKKSDEILHLFLGDKEINKKAIDNILGKDRKASKIKFFTAKSYYKNTFFSVLGFSATGIIITFIVTTLGSGKIEYVEDSKKSKKRQTLIS